MNKQTPITSIKGVGPAVAQKLQRLGIETVSDLLNHVPTRYEDYSKVSKNQFLEFSAHPKPIKRKITEEWSNDDWILWKVGECKRPKFNFIKFAKENPKPDIENWPCLLAEWWLNPKYKPASPSPLAKVWKKFIASPVIPYDKDERQRLIADAYSKLETYVQRHEEKRKELEKKKRKRKIILQD